MIIDTHKKERGRMHCRLIPPDPAGPSLVPAELSVHCARHGQLAMINENGHGDIV
jgi:hypothetical protein